MINFTGLKTGFFHPDKALKFLFTEDYVAKELAKKKINSYFNNYKDTREYNKKKSPYFSYFDLCKRILTDSISDESIRVRFFEDPDSLNESEISKVLEEKPDSISLAGTIWPKRAHTMIGLMKLENLQFCVEETIRNNVQGDLIETGVWKGGATIFMRIILKKYGIKNKMVYVADSFQGLPEPDVKRFPVDAGDKHHTVDYLKISLEEVKNNFKLYGVLDEQVKFIKGYFEDTMKILPIEKISMLRMDGDMYGSTWVVLENLYEKLSVGGFLTVDDYDLKGAQKATDDFRKLKNIKEPIIAIDGSGTYWKKEI